jgi:hypothetical protein
MMSLTPGGGGGFAGSGAGADPGAVGPDPGGEGGLGARAACPTTEGGRGEPLDGIGEVAATGDTELELACGAEGGPSTPPTKIVRAEPISAAASGGAVALPVGLDAAGGPGAAGGLATAAGAGSRAPQRPQNANPGGFANAQAGQVMPRSGPDAVGPEDGGGGGGG